MYVHISCVMVVDQCFPVIATINQANTTNTEIIPVSTEFEFLSCSSCKSISDTCKRLCAFIFLQVLVKIL